VTIEEIRARLAAILARQAEITASLTGINERAGGADLTDDAATEWDALTRESETLTAEHAERTEELRTAELRARANESRARWGADLLTKIDPWGTEVRDLRPDAMVERARAMLDTEVGQLMGEKREGFEKLLRMKTVNVQGADLAERALLTTTPAYRSAFAKVMTQGLPILTAEEGRAITAVRESRAAMNITTDTQGGFAVPVPIDPTIILTAQESPSDIVDISEVINITNDQWRGVSSAGVTWAFRAEAASSTDGSPTIAQPTVITHRADGWVPFSVEVGQDWPGFAEEFARLLGIGYRELLVQKLTVGAGDASNEPWGIVTRLAAVTASRVASTTAGAIGAVDVNATWAALPIRNRGSASRTAWMSSTGVNNAIQALGSALGAAFTVDLTADGVAVVKGRRMYENDYMAAAGVGTAAANELVVADWRNYVVAQRIGMNVELMPLLIDPTSASSPAPPTGQRGWFAWARVGADLINPAAGRLLQNKTS